MYYILTVGLTWVLLFLFIAGKISFCVFFGVISLMVMCAGWIFYRAREAFLEACDEYYECHGERYHGDPRKD